MFKHIYQSQKITASPCKGEVALRSCMERCVQGMGRVSRFLLLLFCFFNESQLMKANYYFIFLISTQPALPGLSCGELLLCLHNGFESLTAIGRANPALRSTRKTGSFSSPPPFFHCCLSCASPKADFVNKVKIPLKSHCSCLWQEHQNLLTIHFSRAQVLISLTESGFYQMAGKHFWFLSVSV